jgi:transposase
MADKDSGLRVVRQSRDGRRRYDESGKRALVEAAIRPGVSVSRIAQEHGINANLLRKWITKYLMERETGILPATQDVSDDVPPSDEGNDGVPIDPADSHKLVVAAATPSAFVPVVSAPAVPTMPWPPPPSMALELRVRLANGVELELGQAIASIDELATLVQILGRMPCSGSTTI